MIKIDFLQYAPKLVTKVEKGKTSVLDPIRGKYILLQPEESVRQLVLYYFIHVLSYPTKRIQVEKMIRGSAYTKRFDIIVYDKSGAPTLLVECKSYKEKINQNVFDQISDYNQVLHVDYLLVTNGIETHVCKMNYQEKSYTFLKDLPSKSTFA